jgi:Mn-dependent DtxR family transcriptional regulator
MILQESAEMYLETIYQLQQGQKRVRAVDIARKMGYSKPTVSEWMGKLRENDYLHIADDGSIELTEKGLDVARTVFERHVVLAGIFESLGVSKETALKDACRVEHYISDETFTHLKKHYERNTGKASDS